MIRTAELFNPEHTYYIHTNARLDIQQEPVTSPLSDNAVRRLHDACYAWTQILRVWTDAAQLLAF